MPQIRAPNNTSVEIAGSVVISKRVTSHAPIVGYIDRIRPLIDVG